MMIDAGMRHVTLAEATFTFNIISHFKATLNIRTFQAWIKSMLGLGQKAHIMYSQYLNVAKMKLVTDHDFERQRLG